MFKRNYGTIGFLGVIILGSLILSQIGMTEGMTEDPEAQEEAPVAPKVAAPPTKKQ